jgi:DNA-binding beta-propeller fold protein YncE
MRAPSFLLALCAGALALAGPARGDTVTLKPAVHMLGEWVDGMVSDGKTILIAETGQSTIVELDGNYRILRRIRPGGSPLKIALGRDGTLYALLQVEDDIKLWLRAPGGAARMVAGLGKMRCATALAAGEGAYVWVLTGCNDEKATLLRIDPRTNAVSKVALGPGGGGGELLLRPGQVWVGLDRISVVEEATLAIRTVEVGAAKGQAAFGPLAADAARVYAGATDEAGSAVIAIDPATLKETARTKVDAPITVLLADGGRVIAAASRLSVLAAGQLGLQRVIDIPLAEVEPRSLMLRNGDLLITDFRIKDARENGALLVLHGWQPR